MLVKHKGRLIDCYMNKDMVCFSVYNDKPEDGPLEVLDLPDIKLNHRFYRQSKDLVKENYKHNNCLFCNQTYVE